MAGLNYLGEVHTAVGADAISDVKWFGEVGKEPELRSHFGRNETEVESGGAHENPGARSAIGEDEFPFLDEGLGRVMGQPVLMIEQDVMGIDSGVLLQKLRDGASMRMDSISAGGEHSEVFLAQIIRTARKGVRTGYVYAPKIVFPRR